MYPFYLGLDLHKKNTYAVLIDQTGAVIDQRQISNDKTLNYLEEFVPRDTYAVLEATRNWPFMYDLHTHHVARVELAHPKELKAISSAAVKTDQIDAKVLAQLARLNYLPTAYAAPPETRDLRLYVRHREILVQERTQCKNRVHAVLARYNLQAPVVDIFGKTGREWVKNMLDGELLRTAAKRVIQDHLSLIDHLDRHIEALSKEYTLTSKQMEAVKLLKTMPGVGKIIATTIEASMRPTNNDEEPETELTVLDDVDGQIVEQPAPEPIEEAPEYAIPTMAYIGPDDNIWVLETGSQTPRQITVDANRTGGDSAEIVYGNPLLSSDGTLLVYYKDVVTPSTNGHEFTYAVWLANLITGERRQILDTRFAGMAWKPGTHLLAYGHEIDMDYSSSRVESDTVRPKGIHTIDLDSGEIQYLVAPERGYAISRPNWSPDGRSWHFQRAFLWKPPCLRITTSKTRNMSPGMITWDAQAGPRMAVC